MAMCVPWHHALNPLACQPARPAAPRWRLDHVNARPGVGGGILLVGGLHGVPVTPQHSATLPRLLLRAEDVGGLRLVALWCCWGWGLRLLALAIRAILLHRLLARLLLPRSNLGASVSIGASLVRNSLLPALGRVHVVRLNSLRQGGRSGVIRFLLLALVLAILILTVLSLQLGLSVRPLGAQQALVIVVLALALLRCEIAQVSRYRWCGQQLATRQHGHAALSCAVSVCRAQDQDQGSSSCRRCCPSRRWHCAEQRT